MAGLGSEEERLLFWGELELTLKVAIRDVFHWLNSRELPADAFERAVNEIEKSGQFALREILRISKMNTPR